MAVVVLAGCMEDGDSDSASEAGAEPGMAPPADGTLPATETGPVKAPLWNVGDWWSYQVDYDSGESYDARFVVHAEDSGRYLVTADDRELVLRAAFTHYPTFGAVSASDLSQDVHGTKVQYLRFPLQHDNWTGTFRDFPASYTTVPGTVQTGKGPLDGFVTTMRNSDDGLVRMSNGYSPEAKWFTNFTFDFDGVAPQDVVYTLQDWGANHTGSLPVLEVVDGVHRVFPTLALPAPDPANPPAVPPAPPAVAESHDTMEIAGEGSSLLWGLFAGAGGQGVFEFSLSQPQSGAPPHHFEWQPTGFASLFEWGEIPNAAPGQWEVLCTGAAQGFAFMFCETYEVRTSDMTL